MPPATSTPSASSGAAGVIVPVPNDDPPAEAVALDLSGVPAALGGAVANPFLIWLLTAAGGTVLYLGLVRRPGDDDATSGQMILATALPERTSRIGSEPGTADGAAVRSMPRSGGASPVTERRAFDAPPAKGVERAVVDYHKVRISSKPDGVRSVELGRLGRGDEVEIVDSYAGFLQVRTPDGITGWVPRHTIVNASNVTSA